MASRRSERGQVATVVPIVVLLVALVVVIAVAVVLVGRSGGGGGGDDNTATAPTAAPTTAGEDREPQVSPRATTTTSTTAPPVVLDLLTGGGFPAAYQDLLAAAGASQVYEIDVYPGYAFLAYQDPVDPTHLDRRQWRDGRVGDAGANTGADRVDERTQPGLFGPAEVDPTLLDHLVADAPLQYDLPVAVSHVIVNRFLPFDPRVLIRVYAQPTDGRSGGGYVSYDTAGTLVNVCC